MKKKEWEMNRKYLTKDIKKDWLLYFSAIITWLLVAYSAVNDLTMDVKFFVKTISLLLFITLFFVNTLGFSQTNNFNKAKLTILAQVLLVWLLIYYDRNNLSPILLVLIATQLANLFTRTQTILVLLMINVGYYFVLSQHQPQPIFTVLIFLFFQLFGYSTIEIMIRAQQDREKLAQINQELLATRFMLKESSQRKERLRISRDLHDVIGHQLTALSLNLEVSSHKVPNEFKPMLRDNLQQAKNLLSDVREVVKEMRNEEEFDLIATLNGLIAQLPNCQLDVINYESIKSLYLKQQLAFCLQEGISNALRHGKADKVTLDFETIEDKLHITLQDNGKCEGEFLFGNGLTGMQERLAEFKGTIELIKTNTGAKLIIQVEDCYD
jgi:signal transduction histidine kinase